jgi:hypothetical protein
MQRHAVLALLCLVVTPGGSLAADEPPEARPGVVKRALHALTTDPEDGAGRGPHLGPFFPRLEIVSSGAGLSPMLHFWLPGAAGGLFDVHASAAYSVRRYQYYDAQLGRVPHLGDSLPPIERGTSTPFPLRDLEKSAAVPGVQVYASARYRDYPREDFYGIGASSLQVDRSDYRRQDGLYEGIVRFRVAQVSFMGRAGLLQTSIRPGTDPGFPSTEIGSDEVSAPGLLRAPDFFHLSAGAWLELRDQPGNPHRGASLGASFSRFEERHGSGFQFDRTVVDARQYLPLGSGRHLIALRQVASLDRPDAGSSVPFFLQTTLGGSKMLRGYSPFRFRDDKLLALAGEYRFELRPSLELALIGEAAKVFPTMGDFDLRQLRHSWGLGIRIKSPHQVHVRVDVLHSAETTRFDFKLGPSF